MLRQERVLVRVPEETQEGDSRREQACQEEESPLAWVTQTSIRAEAEVGGEEGEY